MEKFILSTGTELSDYSAVMIAEGVEKAECMEDLLLAWSYIGKKMLYMHLQGFFGRTLRSLYEQGFFDENFNIIHEALEA